MFVVGYRAGLSRRCSSAVGGGGAGWVGRGGGTCPSITAVYDRVRRVFISPRPVPYIS